MSKILFAVVAAAAALGSAVLVLSSCEQATVSSAAGYGPTPTLPAPNPGLFPTVHIAPAVGWPKGVTPTAVDGMKVTEFAEGFDHPRWLHVLPNGDVLVAESNAPAKPDAGFSLKGWVMGLVMARAGAGVPSADRITLLRDADGDGVAETRTLFLENLHSPFGMALIGATLYVANTDAIVAFPYETGATRITAPAKTIVALPAGPINHHWTKDIIASPDGTRLFATIGSNSNVGDNGMAAEENRAAVLEITLATQKVRLFASGLRNPNGLAWQPETGALWVAVNERDEIGSDLVPDYMTSVRDGGFYGWPYSYYGQHVDARPQPARPDLVVSAIVPDYALGAHTGSLGLTFNTGALFPASYKNGAFIGQHGSWNREPPSGYKVIFVPFAGGKPSGDPQDILTGFVNAKDQAMGRPVGVAIDRRGALLVADDVGNKVWRVVPDGTGR
ncbi:sorbosone dehydrogenase [Elstera litoralis]|uniref:Sorbosone dehydrogenase n=1 Tax=Elstera litoralis TaxID=552518 RepID=A0A0F3IVD7_9PROT|nr:sorbosone dehydrogenase family protein [Elstera litoralis]KJV10656.1 sorbosone dehydrogenase [Elstera litoralis]